VYYFENISRKARREAKNAKIKTLVAPLHLSVFARNKNIFYRFQTDTQPEMKVSNKR
jgi:hypothetical protein